MCWIHHIQLQRYVLDTPHKVNLYKFCNTSLTILSNKHFFMKTIDTYNFNSKLDIIVNEHILISRITKTLTKNSL